MLKNRTLRYSSLHQQQELHRAPTHSFCLVVRFFTDKRFPVAQTFPFFFYKKKSQYLTKQMEVRKRPVTKVSPIDAALQCREVPLSRVSWISIKADGSFTPFSTKRKRKKILNKPHFSTAFTGFNVGGWGGGGGGVEAWGQGFQTSRFPYPLIPVRFLYLWVPTSLLFFLDYKILRNVV